jgi:trehalose/maltose hydrolase-like predicted phosphorylase
MTSSAKGAIYVSVGKEPNGVPQGVCHLGGGTEAFANILEVQMRAWRAEAARDAMAVTPTGGNWAVTDTLCSSRNAASYETIFTAANGYPGTRGAHEDGLFIGKPATLIAGVFDQAPGEATEPVVAPDWLAIRLAVDGTPISTDQPGGIRDYARALDMASRVLSRTYRHVDSGGRTVRVDSERFESIDDVHLVCMSYRVTVEAGTGTVTLSFRIDGNVANAGTVHLAVEETSASPDREKQIIESAVNSGRRVVMAGREIVTRVSVSVPPSASVAGGPCAGHDFQVHLAEGDSVTLGKYVAVFTSRDLEDGSGGMAHPSSLAAAAKAHGTRAAVSGFGACLAAHSSLWAARWAGCDVRIAGPDIDQAAMRFALFHTMSAASKTDRRKAAERGYKGAVFAWESADTGDETTPEWTDPHPVTGERIRVWCGDMEDHVTADISHAVWSCWRWTGDLEFLLNYGAEIIIDAARFRMTRATWNDWRGRYECLRVTGPDEFHDSVNNNAFTNHMAKWNMDRAIEIAGCLRAHWPKRWAETSARLGLDNSELAEMERVSGLVYLPEPDPKTNILEQFDGYHALE